ncbi:FkbM family methyltransferase [Candidatus Pelagibacter sp.]|nr:FkbM family methyltransferase [Candidatus Pelagibacter sp.]
MRIEEKLKNYFLYQKKLNLMKILYFFFQFLKSKLKPRIINANWGLDKIICDVLKRKKKGIYIDIGCHHPLINNNTYLLNKRGWKGINVDLDFNSIDMFNFFRGKDHNQKIALSNYKGFSNLYFFHNRAAKNTISKKSSKGAKLIKKINVDTLNNIIKNCKFKINEIDFLSIDVEGNELNVLKGLNFKRYKPKVVVLEYIKPSIKEFYHHKIENIIKSEIYMFMKKKNYKLVNWVHDDLVFVPNKITKY